VFSAIFIHRLVNAETSRSTHEVRLGIAVASVNVDLRDFGIVSDVAENAQHFTFSQIDLLNTFFICH
jgi:hypothetical protein